MQACIHLAFMLIYKPMITFLKWLFGLSLFARFLLPFYMSPMLRLFSDPARHFENGQYFLAPHMMGGIDPKLYQLWLWFVRNASLQDPALIACFTGLLCAAMPYVWYRVARELFSKKTALMLGIFFALFPPFAVIYAFFMNETLLLVVTGLAIWLTLRAYRKQTLAAFTWAAFAWVLCATTRLSGVPMAAVFLGFLLWHQPHKKTCALVAGGFFGFAALLTGWHSYKAINVFSPFYFTPLNEIYYYSDSKTFGLDMADGVHYTWSMSSFFINPLDPLMEYHSYRSEAPVRVPIDLKRGVKSWNEALAPLKANYNIEKMLYNMRDNIMYFSLGPPWPDSGKNDPNLLLRLNYHLRWLWAPIILLVLASAPFYRGRREQNIIIWGTTFFILCAFIQNVGVMEGRFRKPLEPLMVISTLFIIQRLKVFLTSAK